MLAQHTSTLLDADRPNSFKYFKEWSSMCSLTSPMSFKRLDCHPPILLSNLLFDLFFLYSIYYFLIVLNLCLDHNNIY